MVLIRGRPFVVCLSVDTELVEMLFKDCVSLSSMWVPIFRLLFDGLLFEFRYLTLAFDLLFQLLPSSIAHLNQLFRK